MVPDRDADGKILGDPRLCISVSGFIAAPVDQKLIQGGAPPDLSSAFAIARQENIAFPHRRSDSNRYRLLSKRCRECTEPAGTLQIDALGIECPGEAHAAIERIHELLIAAKAGKLGDRLSILVEILPTSNLEPSNDTVGQVLGPSFHQ
jgi:hypothetical protein